MIIDAIVLAGGRASRLEGASKAGLSLGGRSLLERTLDPLAVVRRIVVVGDPADIAAAAPSADTLVARELPIFAGPAAGIAAGLDALGAASNQDRVSDFTVVVACDMPAVGGAIEVLLAAVRDGSGGAVAVRAGSDGAVAVSPDGRVQPLVGVYSTLALAACIARHRDARNLENLSVRALLSGLDPALVSVPEGSTDDIDTWADAARHGVLARQPQHERD